MSKKTFKGGIHPLYFKELSKASPIRRLNPPSEVAIPLIQHTGAPCLPKVNKGDEVKAGTCIGESDKFISSPIHSSLSGKVKTIKRVPHPVLGSCDAVVIESDGKDEKESSLNGSLKDAEQLSADEIIRFVKDAGIVGLGGAAFPTHVKLKPPAEKSIDTFILNGAECEPYLTCDERVMIEKPDEVIKGAVLMMKALGLKRGIIAIEDNKPEAIKAIRKALNDIRHAKCDMRTVVLHTKYPQGGEKQLIKALLNREVPHGGLPFDVGCIVDNIQTAYAVYEAIYQGKPLYERVITVTGDAVSNPSNLLVRIGTPLSYIIDNCGGFKSDPSKIIMGGPMMGLAQFSNDTPVIKGTSGVLILSEKQARQRMSQYCIRCGKCIEACPLNLVPTDIARAAEYENFDMANELYAKDCMECGACAYSCPSNIELVQLIKHAKNILLRRERKDV
ncbi:MAG: electron transport complex subunit RsxC [Candidatus Omnitrophota bacterium]